MSEKPIATAADFEQLAKNRTKENSEPLTLPSGLTVIARRPSPNWWLRNFGRLPETIAARASGQDQNLRLTVDELVKYSQFEVQLVSEVVLNPVIRLNPGPGEVDPNLITDDDLLFIVRYARGEISADGRDLEAFRRERAVAAAGTGGKGIQHEAEPVG